MPVVRHSFMLIGAAAAMLAAPLIASPASAQDLQPGVVYGDVDPLSDDALAAVAGMGIDRHAFLRRAARDQIEDFDRQTAEVSSVTFDNWFNDVGTPLIVANLSR